MLNAVLDVLSFRFVFLSIFLSRGRFLRPVRVFALIGGFCGLWLRFSRGPLCLRRCSLCTVDRCEHYGRLQGTKKKSVYIRRLNCVEQKTKCSDDNRGQKSCR